MTKNFMSSVLDELMGRDRDALPTDKPRAPKWDDPDICTHYLVCSFCPHDLFVNTKADIGPCVKLHDEQLRKRYLEEANSNKKSAFEGEFIRFAEKMISDIEAKIKRGKIRIQMANGPDGGTYAGPGSKNAEKIALLTERINALLSEAESAGCDGDVEKAQGLMKLCDQLKDEREQLKSNEVNHPWNPDKAMQVCEVCGSYLIIGEAQHRLDDHIMGKQHVGFAMLRKSMDDIRKAKEIRDKEDREKMEREREKRRQERGKEVEREKERERDRDRSRRDRDRRRRSGSRSRRRSKDRRRSSERDKDHSRRRSRSRDRKDKDIEHKRDSSKDYKSRHSDGKKRSKRSRSRSGSREKDRQKKKRSSRSRSRDKKDRRRKDKDGIEKKVKQERNPSLSSREGSPSPSTSTSEKHQDRHSHYSQEQSWEPTHQDDGRKSNGASPSHQTRHSDAEEDAISA